MAFFRFFDRDIQEYAINKSQIGFRHQLQRLLLRLGPSIKHLALKTTPFEQPLYLNNFTHYDMCLGWA